MSKDISSVNREHDQIVPSESLLGQWFWVKGREGEWFACVTEEGSNYVKLSGINEGRGGIEQRIHHNDMDEKLRAETNPNAVITERVGHFQAVAAQLMTDVQELTSRLGVVPTKAIADQSSSGMGALAVVSEQADTTAYKQALIKAKKETLPELFKELELANKAVAGWMGAPTLSLMATMVPLKETLSHIDTRIETISLYAGLTEEAVKCCDGDPAGQWEKLHVMQRRLYMDEECMLSYTGGGIDINDIGEFDEWIARPENRDRLLPFPRTIAAFRVRRDEKERGDDGSFLDVFVKFMMRDADKKTFFYVRNGEQVWRIDADFMFPEMIFPDLTTFDPTQPMMFKMFGNSIDEIIPLSQWEGMRDDYLRAMEQYEERMREYNEWEATHPGQPNPHRYYSEPRSRHDEYKRLDPSTVYFDDASSHISDEIKRYNWIAVIIQGLFDRSLVLHPHPPVKVWDPASFSASVKLIYDSTTLTSGEKPDFAAYRASLNALIDEDSVLTGQEDYWMRVCAEKRNEQSKKDSYRHGSRHSTNYRRYRPYGDPGPGMVALASSMMPRAKKAKFSWRKEAEWHQEEGKARSITVPFTEMLNVSAYKPGDFKQFFHDPRTRMEYLKWAPLMLAAEDYHAGKATLGTSSRMRDQYR